MFPELQDYGLVFLLLAVFGFIILDVFKTGQYWGIPDFYKNDIEKFFHYVSSAVLFLSFTLVIIGLAITSPNKENAVASFVNNFFSTFDRYHQMGIISDDSYTTILKIFVFSTTLSFIYVLIYFFVFISGLYI